jgi:hypothetical protein
MADRYQERQFPADDDYGREADRARPKSEADPLAELARLIGQSDPFPKADRAAPRRAEPAPQEETYYEADAAPPGPPPWMARANAQGGHQSGHHEPQQQEFENLHPVQRYAVHPELEPDYHPAPAFAAEADHYPQEPADPARYDEALYGQPDHGQEPHAQDPYPQDPYGYQDGYEEPQAPKRRSGLVTVGVVLALAVVGTGAAFAYRTFVGTTRSGEPPVIKADTGPNKMVPPSATGSADANSKLIQDRLGGAAPEKLVSREETPVNVQDNTKAGGPRVVFPPLNQNSNPPSTASVSPANKPMVGNAAVNGDEPRKIRTFAVKGDQTEGATPASRQAPAKLTGPAPGAAPARGAAPTNANASANAPMSLSPQGQAAAPAPAPARVANNAPTPLASAPAAGGGYLVQIASQRSEAEASASFRALQGKYPSVLGSRSATIKRADLGEKGTYYRAMVGPFGSPDEATSFCGNLKSAGGQCVVQRN